MKLKTYIRFINESDTQQITGLEVRNRTFFQKYLFPQSDEFYTFEYQSQLINNNIIQRKKDRKYVFGIFDAGSNQLIGKISLANIMRGPLQTSEIGYYLDQQHNSRGHAYEGVCLAVKYGLEELGLNRIVAYVMPSNSASVNLLKKIGFQEEGLLRKYLMFNGKWEDHLLMSFLSEDNVNLKSYFKPTA
jgi:Acetyltransferases, including N-acetylases of ribosomal proteins